MKKQYYLSNNGTHIGPYSHEVILEKIKTQQHQCTDYVFDEQVGDWLMLLEHPDFMDKVNELMPAPVKPEPESVRKVSFNGLKDKEWFVLKGGSNYGPFCQLELVQMLQEKTLYEHDYVWHSKLPAWKRVAEVEDFTPDNIRQMKESNDIEVAEIFFRRRHIRASYGASLIVHNNKTVFRGKALEISAGGAGVIIDSSNLEPGQSLFLHFKPGDGVPPFNVVCQVVSKTYLTGSPDDSCRYGVKFTTLSQSARESIKNFTSQAA